MQVWLTAWAAGAGDVPRVDVCKACGTGMRRNLAGSAGFRAGSFATKLAATSRTHAGSMINNDILRSIRYMLDLSDNRLVIEIVRLSWIPVRDRQGRTARIPAEGRRARHVACSDRVMAHFLDGLVIHRRGPRRIPTAAPAGKRINNNVVLEEAAGGVPAHRRGHKQAFADAWDSRSRSRNCRHCSRQPGTGNFRLCGDQLLRNFLKGLTLRVRRLKPVRTVRRPAGSARRRPASSPARPCRSAAAGSRPRPGRPARTCHAQLPALMPF